ncbi:MAG: hypothetical protein H7A04_10400 [Pseudomonadales bacterium]|nr:hypothetical protein [Pseudomonadales bacterium]
MPRRMTATKDGTRKAMKNVSFESQVAGWLMQDGWQVFTPLLDNGHSTDLLVSDGPHYYRIQVKTVEATGDNHYIENKWKESYLDVVVVFARNSNWGYVMPAFTNNRRKLNFEGHQKFINSKNEFLKAFHKL